MAYWETCEDNQRLQDFRMKDYRVFLENCRPYPNTTTLLLCKVVINEEVLWFLVRNVKYTHSEIQAIAQIGILENMICGGALGLSEVEFYLSYSPCLNCANILAQYISDRNKYFTYVRMTLRFSSLYKPWGQDQNSNPALEVLKECMDIDVSTFSEPDWDILESKVSYFNPDEVDFNLRDWWDSEKYRDFQTLSQTNG